MRCGRADRVELDAFLLGHGGDAETESFRAHYATCNECARVVADWTALEDVVRDAVPQSEAVAPGHPEPEELAEYAEAPKGMGGRAMQIETHLAGCVRCAGELRLIQGFDPARFAVGEEALPFAARAAVTDREDPLGRLRESLAGFFERLRGFDWLSPAPALALAVVILAGLWLTGRLERGDRSGAESGGPILVEQSAPPRSVEAPSPAPEPPGAAPEAFVEAVPAPEPEPEVAPELAPEPEPEPQLAAESPPASEPAPQEIAQTEPPAVEPRESDEGTTARSEEEILLASVDSLPPPDYAMPGGNDSVAWMRQFGAVRSAPGDAHVLARAPGNHTGLTLSRRPRLWWALDVPTDLPIQLTIVDDEAIDPIVRVELPGPHSAGLHRFDLDRQGVELAPGVDYRWFVSIVVDPDRPSRNPVSAGSLRVAGESDARRAAVSSADASMRGNKLAELGLWYDAFDFYASLAAAHPDVERLAAYRDRLVEAASASR